MSALRSDASPRAERISREAAREARYVTPWHREGVIVVLEDEGLTESEMLYVSIRFAEAIEDAHGKRGSKILTIVPEAQVSETPSPLSTGDTDSPDSYAEYLLCEAGGQLCDERGVANVYEYMEHNPVARWYVRGLESLDQALSSGRYLFPLRVLGLKIRMLSYGFGVEDVPDVAPICVAHQMDVPESEAGLRALVHRLNVGFYMNYDTTDIAPRGFRPLVGSRLPVLPVFVVTQSVYQSLMSLRGLGDNPLLRADRMYVQFVEKSAE